MDLALHLLDNAQNQPVFPGRLEIVHEREQLIPGSVQYSIKRFRNIPQVSFKDTAMMAYHYEESGAKNNYLELRFCITGNIYCRKKETECDFCKLNQSQNCVEKIDSIDLVSFRFTTSHLSKFLNGIKQTNFTEDLLQFKYTSSFSAL